MLLCLKKWCSFRARGAVVACKRSIHRMPRKAGALYSRGKLANPGKDGELADFAGALRRGYIAGQHLMNVVEKLACIVLALAFQLRGHHGRRSFRSEERRVGKECRAAGWRGR